MARVIGTGPAIIDENVGAFRPAQLAQSLDECRDSSLSFGIVLIDCRQYDTSGAFVPPAARVPQVAKQSNQ
jgi:hypothetical protein